MTTIVLASLGAETTMLRRTRKRINGFDAGGDVLGKLLERERHVASRLEEAKAAAERLISEAREYASNTDASCEWKIEQRLAQLANSLEQDLQTDLQRIRMEAATEARRFAEVNPRRTAALVAIVLEEIGAVAGTREGATG